MTGLSARPVTVPGMTPQPLLRIILSVDPDDLTEFAPDGEGLIAVTADISMGEPVPGVESGHVLDCLDGLVHGGALRARVAAVWGEPDDGTDPADPPLPDVLSYVAARLSAAGLIPDDARIVGLTRLTERHNAN